MLSTCRFYSMPKLGYFINLQTNNFWNRSTFLKKHERPCKSFKESFRGNSVKISDCRAFSPFKTLPACGAFSHSLIFFCIIFFGQEGHRPHSRDRRYPNAYAWMYIMQLPIAHLKNCEPNRYNVYWRILPSTTSFWINLFLPVK